MLRHRVFAAKIVIAALALAFGFDIQTSSADVRVPTVFGSNMVLQRDMTLPVWGWAEPGEEVTVAIGDNKATAKADKDGKWTVKLAPMKAGGPHTISISGKNKLALENVLVGEVWVCSGQSNMEWPVKLAMNPNEEIAAAKYPNIRLFQIPKVPAGTPQTNVDAKWAECTPQSIPGFSAVGYFFGREIQKNLDVPVGIIETAWGGTRIEPWTPPVGFESTPKVAGIAREIEQKQAEYQKSTAAAVDQYAAWLPAAQKAAAAGQAIPLPPSWPTHPLAIHTQPTGLYNGMVHAIVPFAIRGALWYQGESNLGEGMLYHEKMKALIAGWRTIWGQGDFPFLFVQLAPFRYGQAVTALPEIWEAQAATLEVANTGMAVTTDIGNVSDIHPNNKQEVGRRLALWALAKSYGKNDLEFSGPVYKQMSIEGPKVRLSFDHAAGLAARDGKPLTGFTIAASDGKFVDAKAEIDGETVVVSSDAVTTPYAVRFGWQQEANPNLVNKAGLPASPFRTDKDR